MTIRFLQTVPSENPDYPFVAGQEFTFPGPPPLLFQQYLDGVRAVILRGPEPEIAVAVPSETPEPVKRTRRQRRRRRVE